MQENLENTKLRRRAEEFIGWAKGKGIVPACLETEYREKTHVEQQYLFVDLLTLNSPGWYQFPRKKYWKNQENEYYIDEKTGKKKKKNIWYSDVWTFLSGLEKDEHNYEIDKKIWRNTNDSYVTVNAMIDAVNDKGKRVRSNKNCLAVNEMHFDIDVIHNFNPYDAELADEIISYVISIMYSLFPQPTMVVLSGRGIGWFYKYRNPIATFDEDRNQTEDSKLHDLMYQCALEKLRQEFDEWKGVVDVDTVSDYARVTRLPGTINVKAGRFAELYKYDLNLLYESKDLYAEFGFTDAELNEPKSNKKQTVKKTAEKKQNSDSKRSTKTTYEKQLDDDKLPKVASWYRDYAKSRLPMLAEVPKIRSMVEGSGRHDLIFAAYNIARCVFVQSEAVAYAKKINDTFAEPLADADFDRQIQRICAHKEEGTLHGSGIYVFSDKTLALKYLRLTRSEAIEHGWLKTDEKNRKNQEAQAEAEKRDRRIAELWLVDKLSAVKISKQLKIEGFNHVSEKTVRNRLNAMGLKADRTQKLEDVRTDLRYKRREGENECAFDSGLEYGKLSDKARGRNEEGSVCDKTEAFEYNEGIIPDKPEGGSDRTEGVSDKTRTISDKTETVSNKTEAFEYDFEYDERIISMFQESKNLWITGGAGAGKSTYLKWYIDYLNSKKIRYAVVAAGGIAAQNIAGKTLYSSLKIESKIWRLDDGVDWWQIEALLNLDVLIIDEVGTVRADIFTRIWKLICISEAHYRHHVRLVCAGDMLQLPSFYTEEEKKILDENGMIEEAIWKTDAWNEAIQQIAYLRGSKRSENSEFTEVLNKIAMGEELEKCVEYINKNVRVNRTASSSLEEAGSLYLSAYRSSVERVNTNNIKKHKNDDTYRVVEAVPARGKSFNDINDSDYAVARRIILFVGMPVMTVINTENYVNGTRGVIVEIKDDSITMRTNEGKDIEVRREKIVAKNDDTAYFYQFPIVAAYAITIHKAQGLTLKKVVLNPKTFAAGQAYVALSRVRKLDNLILTRKLKKEDIIIDREAAEYMKEIKEKYSV